MEISKRNVKGGIKLKLYMAVTPDKYELPLAVCGTAKELGELFGVSKTSVLSSISKKLPGTTTGRKFIKVEVEDEVCT